MTPGKRDMALPPKTAPPSGLSLPPAATCACIIGDSFVEATQVTNSDSFHGMLSSSFSNIDFYAVGLGGAQLSQYLAFSKFQMDNFKPDKFIFIIIFALVFPAHATKNTNWPTYANDAGSSKYTPITKINADNANQLKTVWTWDSPDSLIVRKNRQLTPWGFKSTPIKIDNRPAENPVSDTDHWEDPLPLHISKHWHFSDYDELKSDLENKLNIVNQTQI